MSKENNEYNEFILSQLGDFPGFRYIPMIGGYIYYYDEKIIGGIYGKQSFMVRITDASKKFMPDAEINEPYPGAKEMMNVTLVDNPDLLKEMIIEMAKELPERKKKK